MSCMWEETPHSYSLSLQTSRKQECYPPSEQHFFALGQVYRKLEPLICELLVEGVPLQMEVYTQAEVSVISNATLKQFSRQVTRKINYCSPTRINQFILVAGEIEIRKTRGSVWRGSSPF